MAQPSSGERWGHEIKFDGYRVQLRVAGGKAHVLTRRGLDWTQRFSEIAADAGGLPECLIDGEVVALDDDGISDFAMLQDALARQKTAQLVLFAFDLLHAQGRDLRDEPLEARKQLLKTLLKGAPSRLRYVEHFASDGEAMLRAACRTRLEGIISKRLDAPYRSGRGEAWTKAKCRAGQEVVIGGWWGDAKTLRSLIVGAYRDDRLVYLGRVGTGFNATLAREVLDVLTPLRQAVSPFAPDRNLPRQKGIVWVKPVTVAEVEFATITSDGLLRQASFKGLREDKDAKAVMPEAHPQAGEGELAVATKAKAARGKSDPEICGITITHPDKVLWPKSKTSPAISKRELAEYYEMAADRLLPELKGRPLSMVRAPDGIEGERFFQRHALMGAAGKIATIKVAGEKQPFLSIAKACDLVALGQAGVLEIHPWGSKAGEPEVPARLVFDLDPNPDVPFARVISAAKEMKARLEQCGLTAFVKTTGGKGLHVVTPIKGSAKKPATWDAAKLFAHVMCQTMERDDPAHYTTNMAKKQRGGKIFLDYLRNDRMATAVAAWSPRAREEATIALPLAWSALTAKIDPREFNIANAKTLLKRADPWKDMMKKAGSLEAASKRLVSLAPAGGE